MTIAEGNIAAAIGLVFAAGASTAIGASIVFFPSLVKRASRRVLASSLGLSAGLMIYLSFLEIFAKSVNGFVEAGIEENRAHVYATLVFFGGVLAMMILDWLVKRLMRDPPPIHRNVDDDIDIEITWNVNEEHHESNSQQQEIYVPHYCMGCTDDPARDLEGWQELAERELEGNRSVPTEASLGRRESDPAVDLEAWHEVVAGQEVEGNRAVPTEVSIGRRKSFTLKDEENGDDDGNKVRIESQENNSRRSLDRVDGIADCQDQERVTEDPNTIRVVVENNSTPHHNGGLVRPPDRPSIHPKHERIKLVKVGYSTALAIFLHNFPEGVATFVAAIEGPQVGAVLAIAIGLHNIPEGICVALPIYYATGNRWKAFRWGCFAGVSEAFAAILGWLVLATTMTDTVYAVVFGMAGGTMLMISMKELIPTAYRYDPEDTVVSSSVIVGMGIMALSLILFKV